MPVTAETLRLLMEAGIEGDDLLRIVESIDSAPEKVRSANAERQARFRERKKAQGVTTNVTSNATRNVTDVTPLARVEDNLQTKELAGQKESKKAAPKALSEIAAFKADLEQDATPEQVEAFVSHRKSKKGQNSAYAAKLFRRDAEACGLSVSEAIDTAISRGWLTVKPEYLTQRRVQGPRSGAPPGEPRTVAEFARQTLREMELLPDEPSRQEPRRVDAGQRSADPPGSGITRRFAIPANPFGSIG